MELLDKLRYMIAIHQSMMASDGQGHHQPLSFAEVFTGGDFGNAVARTHIGGMLHIGEREPRHSRIMNGVGTVSYTHLTLPTIA